MDSMKEIYDSLRELAAKYRIYSLNEPIMKKLANALQDLEYKLQKK